ncbi:chondroitin sulfate proteoglycan 5 isoform X2 [Trichomycterus rosablanca]|uniref:chondroitin sulfate proteoglycan 5 isoform X2 n=1 Tax=Trichomycterus rosablanca TaxID=2290929 RepID=UPI002F35D8F6
MKINTVLCSGCWNVSIMVSALVVLLPLLAHANSALGNVTESASINVTAARVQSDEDAGSGLQGEELFPTNSSLRATDQGAAEISQESAETDNLLPNTSTRGFKEEEEEETTARVTTQTATEAPTQTATQTATQTPTHGEEMDTETEAETETEATTETTTHTPWHGEETDTETTMQTLWHDEETDTETTVFDLNHQEPYTTMSPSPPHHAHHPEVLTVGFFDTDPRGRKFAPPTPTAHELQGHDATSWDVSESYDEPTTYEDTATPSTYDESTTVPTTPRIFRPHLPNHFIPPQHKMPLQPPRDAGTGTGRSVECRLGLVRINGTCRSQCDVMPNYCNNGGQCVMLEGSGIFCRCNIQDYMWHKGSRCESVITEFQVMCIAVGSSALTVLLLFMIVVCFAKKLHVLKTENNKLRKRSKYRASSEQHNDNFSLSTIAEGSNPNKTMSRYTWETKEEPGLEDDPNAQNKLEDAVKSPPPKEDESLNIQNSLTPKHENHKPLGEENSSEVNSLQNNMM